ncbi:tyrosine-type recombinase/integrase [Streptomyces sp. SD15]
MKGKGLIDLAAGDLEELRFRLRKYALAYVENKAGIEEQYRRDCVRDLDRWIFPMLGECDVRSTEHFNSDTVQAWVRVPEKALVHKGQMPKNGAVKWRKMSPKTIRNLHGLLSAVLERAVKAEPPLRSRNPCELTRLPRADDDGAEDMEFLTPDEVEGVIGLMERRSDQLLATIKYGTGMRWGEISALAPECLVGWGTDRPKVRVKRAWKRGGEGGYYVGMPKARRSRRTIRVSQAVVEAVNELGGEDTENPDRLFFTGDHGRRLHYSTHCDRWQRAVTAGLMPKQKRPTVHDLRHSHAAALIPEGPRSGGARRHGRLPARHPARPRLRRLPAAPLRLCHRRHRRGAARRHRPVRAVTGRHRGEDDQEADVPRPVPHGHSASRRRAAPGARRLQHPGAHPHPALPVLPAVRIRLLRVARGRRVPGRFRALNPQAAEYSWVGRTGDGYRYDHAHASKALATALRACAYVHDVRTGQDRLTDHSALSVSLAVRPAVPLTVTAPDRAAELAPALF